MLVLTSLTVLPSEDTNAQATCQVHIQKHNQTVVEGEYDKIATLWQLSGDRTVCSNASLTASDSDFMILIDEWEEVDEHSLGNAPKGGSPYWKADVWLIVADDNRVEFYKAQGAKATGNAASGIEWKRNTENCLVLLGGTRCTWDTEPNPEIRLEVQDDDKIILALTEGTTTAFLTADEQTKVLNENGSYSLYEDVYRLYPKETMYDLKVYRERDFGFTIVPIIELGKNVRAKCTVTWRQLPDDKRHPSFADLEITSFHQFEGYNPFITGYFNIRGWPENYVRSVTCTEPRFVPTGDYCYLPRLPVTANTLNQQGVEFTVDRRYGRLSHIQIDGAAFKAGNIAKHKNSLVKLYAEIPVEKRFHPNDATKGEVSTACGMGADQASSPVFYSSKREVGPIQHEEFCVVHADHWRDYRKSHKTIGADRARLLFKWQPYASPDDMLRSADGVNIGPKAANRVYDHFCGDR